MTTLVTITEDGDETRVRRYLGRQATHAAVISQDHSAPLSDIVRSFRDYPPDCFGVGYMGEFTPTNDGGMVA